MLLLFNFDYWFIFPFFCLISLITRLSLCTIHEKSLHPNFPCNLTSRYLIICRFIARKLSRQLSDPFYVLAALPWPLAKMGRRLCSGLFIWAHDLKPCFLLLHISNQSLREYINKVYRSRMKRLVNDTHTHTFPDPQKQQQQKRPTGTSQREPNWKEKHRAWLSGHNESSVDDGTETKWKCLQENRSEICE